MAKFIVSVYDRKNKVADRIEIDTHSAMQAEKEAEKILSTREGDWFVSLVDNDYDKAAE